jgi:hypothetical protein
MSTEVTRAMTLEITYQMPPAEAVLGVRVPIRRTAQPQADDLLRKMQVSDAAWRLSELFKRAARYEHRRTDR